ncbi:COG1470 family protein [Pseudothermotoga thermarum]|uniref:S-layer domain-containing protein n=1 Tax=Pseudothermotoga thermarum DSM 5069 TaxID=688269 RepID=F7YX03_9THEM|nr:hypothetical protein [Pseudothermotoga thermarum]AEH50597.1 hypothetical protein Theth_0508 [Pseudothermotoga thermarum DSM 5069]
MKKLFLIIFILAALVYLGQGTFNVRFDPIIVRKTAFAGDKISYDLFIENADPLNPIDVEVSVQDVIQSTYGSYQIAPAGSTSYSAAKWIKVEPNKLRIPPSSTRKITVEVSIPRGVQGGRYASIVLTLLPPYQEGTTSQEDATRFAYQFKYQIPSFLELTIEGIRKKLEAHVINFEVAKIADIPEFHAYKEVVGTNATLYMVSVLNNGNIYVNVSGEINIKSQTGRVVAKYPIATGTVLPGTTVKLPTITGRQLQPGNYNVRIILSYGGHRPTILETTMTVSGEELQVKEISPAEVVLLYVEPGNVEIKSIGGSTRSATVEVVNNSKVSLDVTADIYTLKYDILGDLLPLEERSKAPDWISVSPGSFQLKPGQSRRIRVMVSPPKDIREGGYYYDVIFTAKTEAVKSEYGLNLLVYVGSEDKINQELVGDLAVTEITESSLDVDVYLKNTGNYHAIPSVTLGILRIIPEREENGMIIPSTTQTIATATYSGEVPILPGEERIFGVQIPFPASPGEYEVVARITYGTEKSLEVRKRFKLAGGEEQ